MIENKNYPKIDENGLYIGSAFPLNKDRSGNYLMPGGCVDCKIPEIPEGYVAVLNNSTNGWILKTDNSGEYFNVDTREKIKIDYPLTTIPDSYIKQELSEYESYNKTTKTIEFNLIKYKEYKTEELSNKCKYEREKLFPDYKILNVLTGAKEGYPDYLTSANVSKFIEIYKNIYHTYASKINTSSSKDDVDAVMQEVVFPTEEYIIKNLEL